MSLHPSSKIPLQPLPEQCKSTCTHCGNPVPFENSALFCCAGCETVYAWIQAHRLQKFYDLKKIDRPIRKSIPTSETTETFLYLDDPEFLKLYSWRNSEGQWMELYLEGVHCAACIWLTEKIPELVDYVKFIRLNLGSSIAKVCIESPGKFSAVARELQKMGYRPHPVQCGAQRNLQKKENRRFLARIGVAGASAGNIMLLAISLYGGADGTMAARFRWMIFGLFLPVLIFSGVPFYQSAWAALRSKQISIDVPVAFGILLGSIVSIFNLFIGDSRIYFDSISALIFLLLSTRYVLKRAQQSALESSHFIQFLAPSSVKKWNAEKGTFQEAHVNQVSIGDQVRVLPGEAIPVDGLILNGSSSLNCALLSGESEPKKVGPGDLIFAGTLNLEAPLELQTTQSGSKTRLGRILETTNTLLNQKKGIILFADRVSRYFVAAVLILSGITFIWHLPTDWHEGLNRALAIAIVTCPCTFALITPLALSMTLGRLARAGILIKSPDVLEKLTQVKSLFLDKTGTLTYGTPQVMLWESSEDTMAQVLVIESHSSHPIAKSLVAYLRTRVTGVLPQIEEVIETMGFGIRARCGKDWIQIRRAESSSKGTELSILKNGNKIGRVILEDQIRPEAKKTIQLLKSLQLNLWLLSGDLKAPVLQAASTVGIQENHCLFEASPEEKSRVIQEHSPALMVGDGANDAIALAQAFVGVAVHGGVEISLQAADIYMRPPGIQTVYDTMIIADQTLRVVKRNFSFSILYNLVAGAFAFAGKIDPLFAAILMPLSALTVFLSSIAGTTKMRATFRRLES